MQFRCLCITWLGYSQYSQLPGVLENWRTNRGLYFSGWCITTYFPSYLLSLTFTFQTTSRIIINGGGDWNLANFVLFVFFCLQTLEASDQASQAGVSPWGACRWTWTCPRSSHRYSTQSEPPARMPWCSNSSSSSSKAWWEITTWWPTRPAWSTQVGLDSRTLLSYWKNRL